jgi:hypothetical protein
MEEPAGGDADARHDAVADDSGDDAPGAGGKGDSGDDAAGVNDAGDLGEDAAGDGGAGPAGTETGQYRARRAALALLSVLAVYYAAPVGERPSGGGVVLSALGLLGGVTLLAWLIVRQVRRLMRATAGESVRLDGLLLLVFVVVPTFALGNFALERSDASQFEGLETKTDALYMTLSTLATVGFGDVHAAGQLARALVSVQIVFNRVFVAALVSLVTREIRERAAAQRAAGGAPRRPPGG